MKALRTKQGTRTGFLLALAIWAVAVTLGCHRENPQSQFATRPPSPPPATPTSNPGKLPNNRVLVLDGQTASMRVPDSPSLHSLTNGLTLEVWFKAASFYEQDGSVNSLLRKNVEAGGENFFLRFRIMGGKPAIEMSCGRQILRAPCDVEPGAWYHLAGTYDGKTMTVFVNGVALRSQGVTVPIEIDDADLMIGKGDPAFSTGEYFHGELDDICIWNVARSPEQIRADMNEHLSGKEPGLVAYWTFEDGTAKDLTGNGNNGVFDGDTRIVGGNTLTAPGASESQKK
jgi:Concanavalin A-like lectin/glucanases superfamily